MMDKLVKADAGERERTGVDNWQLGREQNGRETEENKGMSEERLNKRSILDKDTLQK